MKKPTIKQLIKWNKMVPRVLYESEVRSIAKPVGEPKVIVAEIFPHGNRCIGGRDFALYLDFEVKLLTFYEAKLVIGSSVPIYSLQEVDMTSYLEATCKAYRDTNAFVLGREERRSLKENNAFFAVQYYKISRKEHAFRALEGSRLENLVDLVLEERREAKK